jgi:hypothetical protein
MSLVPKQTPNDWNKLQRTLSQLASLKLGPEAVPTFAGISVTWLAASSAIITSLATSSATISSLVFVSGTGTSLGVLSATVSSLAVNSMTGLYAYVSTMAVNTIYTATGINIKVGQPLYFDGA